MQQPTSYRKLTVIMLHVLVWTVCGLFFYYQPVFSGAALTGDYVIRQSVTLCLLIIAFYFNAHFLAPRLLFSNQIMGYILATIALVTAVAMTDKLAERMIITPLNSVTAPGGSAEAAATDRPVPPRPPLQKFPMRLGQRDIFRLIIVGLVVGISTSVIATQKSQRDNQQRKELEKEKISSELSLLRAQINPHFFFNTLNNIYVLTSLDSRLAGEAIHKLSKLMRYLLYETQNEHTLLSHEIDFIKNYISLMQLRLTDVVKIDVNLPVKVNDIPMAPMMLLPFIENAFKHGISATQPSYIDIVLVQKDLQIELIIHNSVQTDNNLSLDTGSGIGLVNTRRRLDLLYPDKYKLDIMENSSSCNYTVHLVLDLS